jgi:hypothetical protein
MFSGIGAFVFRPRQSALDVPAKNDEWRLVGSLFSGIMACIFLILLFREVTGN